jgi:hypothetical protein
MPVKNVQLKTPVSFTHFASKSRRKHISPTGNPPPAMTPSSNFFQRTSIAERVCMEREETTWGSTQKVA